jgi:hypothetical protein
MSTKTKRKPRVEYHVYSLAEGDSWYWTDTNGEPQGPYESKWDALEAITQSPDFLGGKVVLLSDRP